MSAYVHSIIVLVHMDKKDSFDYDHALKNTEYLLKILSNEQVMLNSLSQQLTNFIHYHYLVHSDKGSTTKIPLKILSDSKE